jgi:hypothetical protein
MFEQRFGKLLERVQSLSLELSDPLVQVVKHGCGILVAPECQRRFKRAKEQHFRRS